jgi:hypothetical protein
VGRNPKSDAVDSWVIMSHAGSWIHFVWVAVRGASGARAWPCDVHVSGFRSQGMLRALCNACWSGAAICSGFGSRCSLLLPPSYTRIERTLRANHRACAVFDFACGVSGSDVPTGACASDSKLRYSPSTAFSVIAALHSSYLTSLSCS